MKKKKKLIFFIVSNNAFSMLPYTQNMLLLLYHHPAPALPPSLPSKHAQGSMKDLPLGTVYTERPFQFAHGKMSDDLKEKTKRMAEESKKINSMFGELLDEVEEKLGIESPGKNEAPGKREKREKLETFSSKELLDAKYGEKSVHDFSVDEIYAAMRKRSPGPVIPQPSWYQRRQQ